MSSTSQFHHDGYLIQTHLFSPEFTLELKLEVMGLFHACLLHLYGRGEIEFAESHRRHWRGSRCTSCTSCTSNGASKCGQNEGRNELQYEYPLRVGLKHGYRELVMRSPGRYEMTLLFSKEEVVDNDINNGNASLESGSNGSSVNSEYNIRRNSDKGSGEYNGKWLLTPEIFRNLNAIQSGNKGDKETKEIHTANNDCNGASSNFETSETKRQSCLSLLLKWIQDSSCNGQGHDRNSIELNDELQNHRTETNHKYSKDQMQMQQFMELVHSIFPPADQSTENGTNADANANSTNISTNIGDNYDVENNHTNHNNNTHEADFYLCNFSLLVATPGCPTQSWHADGGHVSLSSHEPCHCFNVFVPLVDVDLSMGPTELRPGTHYHTRNLAPMLLAAKARKTLRPPITPLLSRGDALLFDYRILHRGRANMSDRTHETVGDSTMGSADENATEEKEVEVVEVHSCGRNSTKYSSVEGNGDGDCIERNENEKRMPTKNNSSGRLVDDEYKPCGKDRPVLVMTFARKWFVDVCNFPKRSVFE